MFVLPQILLVGGSVVDRTSFTMPNAVRRKSASGRVKVDGLVRGEINGMVSGTVHAMVEGQVNLNLISGTAAEEGVDDIETEG